MLLVSSFTVWRSPLGAYTYIYICIYSVAIKGFLEVSITVTVVGGAFSVYDDVEGIRLDSP